MNSVQIAIFSLFFLSSCTSSELEPDGLIEWFHNEQESFTLCDQSHSDLSCCLIYKPIEYMIALNNKRNSISKTMVDSLRNEMKGLLYFTLELNQKDMPIENSMFLMFNAEKSIQLTSKHKSISPVFYHNESGVINKDSKKILLIFDTKKMGSKLRIEFNPNGAFTSPIVYELNDLLEITYPRIKCS